MIFIHNKMKIVGVQPQLENVGMLLGATQVMRWKHINIVSQYLKGSKVRYGSHREVSIVSLIHDKSLKHLQTHLHNLSNLHDDTVNNILSETAEPIENSLINNFYFHSNKQIRNNVIINIFGRLYSSSIKNCLTLTKTFLQLYFDIYIYISFNNFICNIKLIFLEYILCQLYQKKIIVTFLVLLLWWCNNVNEKMNKTIYLIYRYLITKAKLKAFIYFGVSSYS